MDPSTATPLIYLLLFSPLLAIPLMLAVNKSFAKGVTLLFSVLVFFLSLFLFGRFESGSELGAESFAFYRAIPWLAGSGYEMNFTLGMDGISLWMVLMTTLLFPLLVLYSWQRITQRVRLYYAMLMVMETGILGFFLALDMLTVYVFFELVLIPSLFLIGIWGGANRRYAALKFFLFTLSGSLLMLVAILYMGLHTGGEVFTTDYFALLQAKFSPEVQGFLFLAFFISFAIKAPVFPFHSWQADAYSEAPVAATVIMAAILSKMGVYGMIRFCLPLFPESAANFAPWIAGLAVISILYGALAAFAQTDLKRLLAYSSLSHIGFIVLGIFAWRTEALSGAVLQMLAHGIATASLFFLAGMVEDRTGNREIGVPQGIAQKVPVLAFFFVLAMLASVGLPGLSGFVGEFMILLGSFGATTFAKPFVVFATGGVILTGVYLLYMTRKIFFGTPKDPSPAQMQDLDRREIGLLVPLCVLMFVIGLYATPFLQPIEKSIKSLVESSVIQDWQED